MDLTVKIKDKKMYDTFVQFFKSLGIAIVLEKKETKKNVHIHKASDFVDKWKGVLKNSEKKEDAKLTYLLNKHQ